LACAQLVVALFGSGRILLSQIRVDGDA